MKKKSKKTYKGVINIKKTPQSEPIPFRNDMAKNNAGGFVFEAEKWAKLQRFLIIGSECGTYYVKEKELTKDNAKTVLHCIAEDGKRVVDTIVNVSIAGKAPKNDPTIFALALCASFSNIETRKYAFKNLNKVCRTGTHFFKFLNIIEDFRGWGRSLQNATARWYTEKEPDNLALQVVKYRQREGWTHRDALRKSKPGAKVIVPENINPILKWVTKNEVEKNTPKLIRDFVKLQASKDKKEVIEIIKNNDAITWEMIPTNFLTDKDVWNAMLPNIPMTALLRNLGRLTYLSVIHPLSESLNIVLKRLNDKEATIKARIHPLSVLLAMNVYKTGKGMKGTLNWVPEGRILDALNNMFYNAFDTVEPTGKRILLALDVSGSMSSPDIANMPGITPRVGSAAMAMVTAKTESNWHIIGFTNYNNNNFKGITPLEITPNQRLDDVLKVIDDLPFAGTDCALPMLYATENNIDVDAFIIYTDSETWAGNIHPVQALKAYRKKTGINAKLIVVGMVANDFTIADPEDPGMLDVVGFSTDTPQLISEFIKL